MPTILTSTTQAPTTSTSAAMPSRTFTPFPKLPPELRLKVWTYAANDDKNTVYRTHVVMIRMKNDPSRCTFKALSPTPALLHACTESRYEALKNYVRCFKIGSGADAEEIVYINPELTELLIEVPRRCCRYRRSLFRNFSKSIRTLGSPNPWGVTKQRVSMLGQHCKEKSKFHVETLGNHMSCFTTRTWILSTAPLQLVDLSLLEKGIPWYEIWEGILTSS